MAVLVDSDRAQVVRGGEEALGIARAIGWRSGEAYALVMLADHFGVRGDYARAFEFATMSLAIAEEIEHSQWITYSHYILGALYLDIRAEAEARRHLELALALANQIGSRWWVTNASGYLALAHILSRDLPRAAEVLKTALETSTEALRGDKSQVRALTLGQRMCWYAAGELALAGGEANVALHIAEELLTSSANLSSGAVIPRLAGLHGRALLALNRFEEAGQALLGARAAAAREGEKPALFHIQAALGSLYHLQGRSQQASEAFLEAQHLAADIASAIPEAPLREAFSRQALAVVPSARPLSARQMAKSESGGLTAREREVARMISRGLSNREMAGALTVGERTIETHVSNILAKLAFSSRTQVATWAVEKGLSGETQS
jgi:DNA-binding CsgD family transcriptional regulator